MDKCYLILLYYCYTNIDDPEKFKEEHHSYCIEKGLLGRIIIAHEGINGTVSGLRESCEAYMNHLKSNPIFSHIQFKIATHDAHAFQKLNVRVKPEIVNSGLRHIDPNKLTGKYISPKELKEVNDAILLDVRSNYEHKLGKFKNAITLDIENFREFPYKIESLKKYKDKKIITYCTGNVKCEKASAYLLEHGFANVYQLHGGIIKYGDDTDGADFEGKCYVFDNRIAVEINRSSPSVISRCYVCNEVCGRMVNCSNPTCNLHVPICEVCADKQAGACSIKCQKNPKRRDYNGRGYYPRKLNGYNPCKH